MLKSNKELQNRLQEDDVLTKTTLICPQFLKKYKILIWITDFYKKKSIGLNCDLNQINVI